MLNKSSFLFFMLILIINIQLNSSQSTPSVSDVYIVGITPTLFGSLCSYEIKFVSNVTFNNVFGTILNSWSVNPGNGIYTVDVTTQLGVFNLNIGATDVNSNQYSFSLGSVNCTNKCPGLNNPCNGNGQCVNGECHCFTPYVGSDCFNQLPTTPTCPSCNCGAHGTCNYSNPTLPTCDCETGYSGTLCEIELPTPNDNFINSLIFVQENQANGKPFARRLFNNWEKKVVTEYNGVYYYYNTSMQIGEYTPSFQIKVVDFYNMYTNFSTTGALQVESSFNFQIIIRNYPFNEVTNTLQLLFTTQIKNGCMGKKKTMSKYSEESFLTVQIPNSQTSLLSALVDLIVFSC